MLPTFIIIGAAKCASTSVYYYLLQHPEVFMCTPKEPNFFTEESPYKTLADYEALFEDAVTKRAIGEASVRYLQNPQACVRIKETIPDVRLIALLRDPAERAYSHYNMLVQHGATPNRPYLDVLKEARNTGNYYKTGIPTSRYAESLQRYFDLFGKDQLRVYLFCDFRRDPLGVVRSIFDYIGVDPAFVPDVAQRHNRTHLPKNNRLHRFIWRTNTAKAVAKFLIPEAVRGKISLTLQHVNRSPVPPLSSEARSLIVDVLRTDVEQTEKILGLNLSAWKS